MIKNRSHKTHKRCEASTLAIVTYETGSSCSDSTTKVEIEEKTSKKIDDLSSLAASLIPTLECSGSKSKFD